VPLRDPDLGRVTTLLCDADGNLFPSEEPAFDASVVVTNRLLDELGSARRYGADELRALALGRNFRSLAADLAGELGRDLPEPELEQWVAEEARVVTAHLSETLVPDAGATAALTELADRLSLAVVSSSALARLAACFTATGLDGLFPTDVRFSAQDSLPRPTSKPDPAVYLHALARLGLDPEQAVAVEDAVAGVRSAVGAGIPTVANLVHVPPAERDGRRAALVAAGAFTVVSDWDEVRDLFAGGHSSRAGAAAELVT
jgi:beta-phosphoglucomutase-like phosphatase (HAD superfamily)